MNEGFNKCHREIKKKMHHYSAFIALILKPRQLQEQRLPLLLWYLEIKKALVPSNYAMMVRANCLTFVTGGKITDAAAPFLLL